MPYQLEWCDDLMVLRCSGMLTSSEILESNQVVIDDERFIQLRCQVLDFLPVQHFDSTSADIRQIAEMDMIAAQKNADLLVICITDSELIHGFFRMYELVSSGNTWTALSFNNWQDASIAYEQRFGKALTVQQSQPFNGK